MKYDRAGQLLERGNRAEDITALLGPVIASGKEREVFIWRDAGAVLAKTLRNAGGKLLRRRGLRYRYSSFEAEHSAWQRILRDYMVYRRPPPVAEPRGYRLVGGNIVQLTAQVSTEDGQIAPTLQQLIQKGQMDEAMLARLNYFARELFAWNIPLKDPHALNIVLEGSGETARFVLVDGYGDVRSVSLRHYSRRYNARRSHRHMAECALSMGSGWAWDAANCRFVTSSLS